MCHSVRARDLSSRPALPLTSLMAVGKSLFFCELQALQVLQQELTVADIHTSGTKALP